MPLVTDCSSCGQRFTTEAAGQVTCPHCSQQVVVYRLPAKAPASDYWQVAKLVGFAFLAVVLLFAFASSFLR